jgi:hypothetical protein
MQNTWRSSVVAMASAVCVNAPCAFAPGCKSKDPGPDLQVVGESTRIRADRPVAATTPWFDGATVRLVAARGEILGIQVQHRGGGPVTLTLPDATVAGFAVDKIAVKRPSTALYGGSAGAGDYADGLTPATAPDTDPAYFEIRVPRDATPGERRGELVADERHVPVVLTIAPVVLPPLPRLVWAYDDPRELRRRIGDAEAQCIAMFADHGVLLSPDVQLSDWDARKAQLAGMPYVPVILPEDPGLVAPYVAGWIDRTAGTGSVPFAIPIDEPRTADAKHRVRALADAVRAAGGGPGKLLYAVTADPDPELGASVDLYITLHAHLADPVPRWTYNGAPPRAGSMVLDAEAPGTRTWGWIAWRYNIPLWYVWDALYWRDRHNAKGGPVRELHVESDPVSFDDGDDHGNLDGVLALPGDRACRPTLRLAALRRGLQDRMLLDAAARCQVEKTAKLAERMVPRALGDAGDRASWSSDEAVWEQARRELLTLAACP